MHHRRMLHAVPRTQDIGGTAKGSTQQSGQFERLDVMRGRTTMAWRYGVVHRPQRTAALAHVCRQSSAGKAGRSGLVSPDVCLKPPDQLRIVGSRPTIQCVEHVNFVRIYIARSSEQCGSATGVRGENQSRLAWALDEAKGSGQRVEPEVNQLFESCWSREAGKGIAPH